jgi:hypothetical protein
MFYTDLKTALGADMGDHPRAEQANRLRHPGMHHRAQLEIDHQFLDPDGGELLDGWRAAPEAKPATHTSAGLSRRSSPF